MSEGSCAGGIVGVNMGLIAPDADTIRKNGGNEVGRDNPVIITGSVKGYKNAGGVMGVNRSVIKDKNGKDVIKTSDANGMVSFYG